MSRGRLTQALRKAMQSLVDQPETPAGCAFADGYSDDACAGCITATSDQSPTVHRPDVQALLDKDEYVEPDLLLIEQPLAYTKRVTFELSNLCNYARQHTRCPLHVAGQATILPARIVYDTLDFLAGYNFAGRIAFHNYNEPLIDPRLFEFVRAARRQCPDSDIYICTNGYYLTQTLADELVEAGVTNMHISAYSKAEYERLSQIELTIPCNVKLMRLDERIDQYDAPITDSTRPCHAPLSEIIVTREGYMSLCCLDWQRRYVLGSLHESGLGDLILSPAVQAIYQRLSSGDRCLDFCRRCTWKR